jgi:cyclopropane-fatty-acyl-phospholipid synthase
VISIEHTETNQHYDQDPRIFELFLGKYMKYSSGYYLSDTDTLETAQRQKIDFVVDRLHLRPSDRLLDIGCGWGSLLLDIADRFDVRAVGLTPAPSQYEHVLSKVAERGLVNRVSVINGYFEDESLEYGAYDAVAMLGSIVHMRDLDYVYSRVRKLLRPGGYFYVSESCFRSENHRKEFGPRSSTTFVRNSIFGWGDMRPVSDLVKAAEDAGWSIVSIDDLTSHYKQTIDAWLANIVARRDRIDDIGPGMSTDLIEYLETANAGWGYTTKHYALTCKKSR